jgi:hypothetical protein
MGTTAVMIKLMVTHLLCTIVGAEPHREQSIVPRAATSLPADMMIIATEDKAFKK